MPSVPHAPRASAAAVAAVESEKVRKTGGIILFGTPDGTRRRPIELPPARWRSLPTAVTIVTAIGPRGPAGATANAVTSLSLDPPLMLACLDRGSRTLEVVRESGAFGVSVLGAGQEALARAFASKAPHTENWSPTAGPRARSRARSTPIS